MTEVQLSSILPKFLMGTLAFTSSFPFSARIIPFLRYPRLSPLRRYSIGCRFLESSASGSRSTTSGEAGPSVKFSENPFPLAGAEEALLGFINGKRKATEVAHSVWKYIIRGGDTAVDATCGNGYDTVAMLKLIADESKWGCVYGLDIQNSALENTYCLLREAIDENERELIKLFLLCHSRMEDIIPKDVPVRLIAFNLGYLPGGDKTIITKPHTTILALQAASRILRPGGLISIVVYVGHPGGWEEFECVLLFVSSLPVESWVSFKYEAVDRPNGPVLLFIFKKRSVV